MRIRTAQIKVTPVGPIETATEVDVSFAGQSRRIGVAEMLPLGGGSINEEEIKRAIRIQAWLAGNFNQDGSGQPTVINSQFFKAVVNTTGLGEGIDSTAGRIYLGNVLDQDGTFKIPFGLTVGTSESLNLTMTIAELLDPSTENPTDDQVIRSIKARLWSKWRFTKVQDATNPDLTVGDAQRLYPVIVNLVEAMELYYCGAN